MKHIYIRISLLALLLAGYVGMSFPQQAHYTLQNNESGSTKAYVARDYINMKPGFVYSASGSNTFSAKIDAGLVFPPAENYMTPAGTTTTDPSQGAAVGSIPGQFAVSPTGAATYTIPIECPSGINGMQPNISLVYNSQAGNGIVGWGWSIGGVSAITISPKTFFSDGKIEGFDLSQANLKMSLDGNNLIPLGNNQFTTENKTYVKIEKIQHKYIVTTKEGMIMEYAHPVYPQKNNGQTANHPFQILLTKATDYQGSFIEYHYKKYSSTVNQIILDRIEYGGNQNWTPSLSIEFQYSLKSSFNKQYIGGYYVEDCLLLKNISLKSSSVPLRSYSLNYDHTDDKYFLSRLFLEEENGESLPETEFVWGHGNKLITVNQTSINNPSHYLADITNRSFISGDIDGDGISELIEIFHRNDYSYRLNDHNYEMIQSSDHIRINKMKQEYTGIEYDNTIIQSQLGGSFDFGDFKNFNGGALLACFNGSSLKTIIVPTYIEQDGNKALELVDVKGNSRFFGGLSYASQVPVFAIGDINNDGIDEMIFLEKSPNSLSNNANVIYIKKNRKAYEYITVDDNVIREALPLSLSGISPNATLRNLFIADFNADGLKDLMIVTSEGSFMMKNNGGVKAEDGIARVSFSQLPLNRELAQESDFSVIKNGDFNGDAMMDFLLYNGVQSFTLHLNNGDFGFTKHALPNVSMIEDVCDGAKGNNKNDSRDDFIVTDFNHDGKSDVLVIDSHYEKKCSSEPLGICISPYANYVNTTITWYACEGDSFQKVKFVSLQNEDYYFKGYATVADFDGDGREDLFAFRSDLSTGIDRGDKGNFHVAFNDRFAANQIKSIYNGMNRFNVSYRPLTHPKTNDNTDFYKKEIGTTYPLYDIQIPLYCVEEVINFSGSSLIKTAYSYEGARSHCLGKGFLGFSKQIVRNLTTGLKTVLATEIDPNSYLPSKQIQTISTLADAAISTSVSEFVNSKSGRIYTSLPVKTVSSDFLTGFSTTVEYLSYDKFGNLLGSKTTQGNLVETRTINYTQAGSWCPNKPSDITVTKSYNGDTYTRRSEYQYDSKGNLTQEITDPADVNKVTTTYSNFTPLGQARTISISANGKTRTSSVTFTPSGRFTASKTNELGETATYQWDEARGRLLSETDNWGKTTHYQYDNWGRLKETRYPDGTRKTEVTRWADGNAPRGAKYYSYSEVSGSSPVWTWYDALGREVAVQSYGLNDKRISVFTEYNTKGQKWRVSEPTFGATPESWAATYSYDDYGRISSLLTAMGTTSTAYSGKSTTVTSPEGTKTTVLNSSGLTESVSTNGKKVSYDYYASGLSKTATPEGGQALSMVYDLQGKRTKLTDPDAGIVETKYNGFGELIEEKQLVHKNQAPIVTSNHYDSNGLLQNINRNGEITAYTYDTDLGYKSRIKSIEIEGKHRQSFEYDGLSRVIATTEQMDGKSWTSRTEYTTLGQVKRETYPSGYYTQNKYDKYGHLTEVSDRNGRQLWKAVDENARGQLLEEKRGGRATHFSYDPRGFTTHISAPGIIDRVYSFDKKGNLSSQTDYTVAQEEDYSYDDLNRLTHWTVYNIPDAFEVYHEMAYDAYGNIREKSDMTGFEEAGFNMNYGENGKPHALTSIDGIPENFSASDLTITYTDFKKIKTLFAGDKEYELFYGVDDQRRKSVYTEKQGAERYSHTRYYLGNYEEAIDFLGNVKKIHYLMGGAILIQENNAEALYYGYSDYLGSLVALTNEAGTVVERYAYDPWGRRRDPDNWTQDDTRTGWIVNRGYTGHEHLDEFGIINMNGRVYDPLTAQFLSPDPYVQAPDNWLNYNRYAYCLNNPLIYTDPTGEYAIVDDIIAGALGGLINLGVNAFQGNLSGYGFWGGVGRGLAAFAAGAVGGVGALYPEFGGWAWGGAIVGATNAWLGGATSVKDIAIGAGIGAIAGIAGGAAGQFAVSSASPLLSSISSPVLRGAATGLIGGAIGGYVGGFTGGLIMTGDLRAANSAGLNGMMFGAVIGGVAGAGAGYKYAIDNKINPWNGKPNAVETPYQTPQAKGQEGVNRAKQEIVAEGGKVLREEVTLEVNGVRVRVDIAADFNGEITLVEVKNGPSAGFTRNQRIVYPQMMDGVPIIPRGANANSVWPGQVGQPTIQYKLIIKKY